MAEEEGGPQCRFCFSGVEARRGLADLLVEPCGCAGTQALVHLSCLHTWRLQQLQTRGTAQHCDVCRQRYRVPAEVWRAAAEAGVVDWGGLRQVQPDAVAPQQVELGQVQPAAAAPQQVELGQVQPAAAIPQQGEGQQVQPAAAAPQHGARGFLATLGKAAAFVVAGGVATIAAITLTGVAAGVMVVVAGLGLAGMVAVAGLSLAGVVVVAGLGAACMVTVAGLGVAGMVVAAGVMATLAVLGVGLALMPWVCSAVLLAAAGALGLAELAVVGLDPTYAAEAAAVVAPTAVHPAVASVALAAVSLGTGIAAWRFQRGDWGAEQRSLLWRLAVSVTKLAGILGLLMCTLHLVSADRSAQGAPSKQPGAEVALEACITFVRFLLAANVAVVNVPARLLAYCVGAGQSTSLAVASAMLDLRNQDMQAAALGQRVMQAFTMRPAALDALHAVLRRVV